MVQNHHHPGSLVPQETNFENADTPGIAQPYSQSEIEDLLYGDDRPAGDRIARLHEMRNELAARESGDFGGEDPAALLDEIDRALEELQGDTDNLDDTGDAAAFMANDPADHMDALSPDDVDAREALIGEDEEGFQDDEDDGSPADESVRHGREEPRQNKH